MINFIAFVLFIAFSDAREQLSCQFQYGPWSKCYAGNQNRTISCLCDDTNELDDDLTLCLQQPDLMVLPLQQLCVEEEEDLNCRWRWTRWSPCTERCGGGETNRSQVCYCEASETVMDDKLCDEEDYFGAESAECNTFDCDDVPARNKLYWIARAQEGEWPMPDGQFNCTIARDDNSTDTPLGKAYSTILSTPVNADSQSHPEWYTLAKEWITIKLNIANGVDFPDEINTLTNQVAHLLDNCARWSPQELHDFYIAKEKLSRINNNIGGLQHVEDQVTSILGPVDNRNPAGEEKKDRSVAPLIVIPVFAILIVGLVIAITVYYLREKKNSVTEKAVFESEDEGSEDEGTTGPGGGASAAALEGLGGGGGGLGGRNDVPLEREKFDSEDSSDH